MIANTLNNLVNEVAGLWSWIIGIIAGWGLTFTLVVIALVLLLIRTVNLQRRVDRLEQRLVHAERDYNLSINQHKGK